jgi:hypothetical protein
VDFTQLLFQYLPQFIVFWVVIAIFSAVANGMPAPSEKDGKAYRWAYNALHTLGADAEKIMGFIRGFFRSKLPAAPADEGKQ